MLLTEIYVYTIYCMICVLFVKIEVAQRRKYSKYSMPVPSSDLINLNKIV